VIFSGDRVGTANFCKPQIDVTRYHQGAPTRTRTLNLLIKSPSEPYATLRHPTLKPRKIGVSENSVGTALAKRCLKSGDEVGTRIGKIDTKRKVFIDEVCCGGNIEIVSPVSVGVHPWRTNHHIGMGGRNAGFDAYR